MATAARAVGLMRCRAPARPQVALFRLQAPRRVSVPRFSFSSQSSASSSSPKPPSSNNFTPSPGRRPDPSHERNTENKAEKPELDAQAKEKLREFEALMMNYLQATAKPLSEGDATQQQQQRQHPDVDPDDAMLDAAAKAFIKKKEDEFQQVSFWSSFASPELRHNFWFILLLALVIGLCLKILRLKGDLLESERGFAAERIELHEQAARAAIPSGIADQEAQADEVVARVQVITGLNDAKDLRLLRQQVLSAIRFTRARMPSESVDAVVASTTPEHVSK